MLQSYLNRAYSVLQQNGRQPLYHFFKLIILGLLFGFNNNNNNNNVDLYGAQIHLRQGAQGALQTKLKLQHSLQN